MLNEYTTSELVKELSMRTGVKRIIAEPYKTIEIKTNGPAIILEIKD